ncbi:beta-1,3-galactosyl-O-glycosyl-glycoprotein beta-1,6-N-acetylglucosaminyltransferase-like isoform X2 [Genypterus blacodes]|uniref:beta-1,3-galactosyl-O-glycosyl-glycoprotein beta-1,6-N-acetylglucosaminyltransferase-like isoform X2 n=1 Tax=Genypterus blacodes TaxID=154954 RepID=UPI003F758196
MLKVLKQLHLPLWLLLSCVLATLWVLLSPEAGLGRVSRLTNSWSDSTEDSSPEHVCNCSGILQGDVEALEQAKLLTITKEFHQRIHIPDESYVRATQDCRCVDIWRVHEFCSILNFFSSHFIYRNFKLKRKYNTQPLSEEEEDLPLAYSIVVHQKVQSFERLLRSIYTPQNLYCIHVDKQAAASVTAAISAIASCFPNVFMVSRREEVVYASWSRVQADLNCMAHLYNVSSQWKYFINLCGQDFPLKTNLETVRMLRSLWGGNSLESEQMPSGKKHRVTVVHKIVNRAMETKEAKTPPPFNLPILSGSAYMVVSRGFIHSVLTDSRIQALMDWAKDTYSPDEFLWATIQRIPGVPGSNWPNSKYDMSDVNAIARLVKWEHHEGSQGSLQAVYPLCHGRHVRSVCVYGAGDLHWMIQQHHLFANKFDTDTDPIAIYCLEKYLRQKALADVH